MEGNRLLPRLPANLAFPPSNKPEVGDKKTQLVCMRGKIPSMEAYDHQFSSPLLMQMEFEVNRRFNLCAIKIMRQVNQSNWHSESYVEDVHLEVYTEKTRKVVGGASFSDKIEYGPAPLELKLHRKIQVEPNKRYLVRIKLMSRGNYVSTARSMTCHFAGATATFFSQDQAKGLLHSLVFEHATGQ